MPGRVKRSAPEPESESELSDDFESESDEDEPNNKRARVSRGSKKKPNQQESEPTSVVVEGKVRHGIIFGKLKLTTSRTPNGCLQEAQRQRLLSLGNYLKFLDDPLANSDSQELHRHSIDFRHPPSSFLQACDRLRLGVLDKEWFRSHGKTDELLKTELDQIDAHRSTSSIMPNMRVTAIDWHPAAPRIAILGDKHGELIAWDALDQSKLNHRFAGCGAGDAIYGLKHDPGDLNGLTSLSMTTPPPQDLHFYAGGVSGTVTRLKLTNSGMHSTQTLYSTCDPHVVWITCLDVHRDGSFVWAGNNKGELIRLDHRAPREHSDYKLHKSKISCVETSLRNPWMLATGGLDSVVKIWDIRSMKDGGKPNSTLYTLQHDKALAGLSFSRMDGNRLLTTDQHSQLRVYSADSFGLERIIPHPHRTFQHLTQIKASWHPLCDVIVVGCYPDPNLPIRQGEKGDVEFFSARTGEVLHRLWNYTNKGIVSLTEFNSNGTSLMIAQGYQVRVVGVKYPKSVRFPRESEFKAMMKSSRKDDSSDSDGDDPPQEKRKRNMTKKKPPAGKSRGAGRGKKKA